MKTYLLLFLTVISSTFCDMRTPKFSPQSLKPGGEEILLNEINELRREVAKEHSYANMWKLEWSDELVQKVKSLPTDCNALKPGADYRFTPLALQDQTEWVRREISYYNSIENRDGFYQKTVYSEELFQASQREVGCAVYHCAQMKSLDPKIRETAEFAVMCLFGPKSTFVLTYTKGEPGSGCEDGEDEDGLCVLSGSPGSSMLFNFSIIVSLVLLVTMVFD